MRALREWNNLIGSFSELYHADGAGETTAYDPLNRLTGFRCGTLSFTDFRRLQADALRT